MTAQPSTDESTRTRYLELLKRTLTGALAEDSDTILGGVSTRGSRRLSKRIVDSIGRTAMRFNLELAYKKPYNAELREKGIDWPARAESMIGLRRMDNLDLCVRTVVEEDVPGDLIETGVWRGGACIFMRGALDAYGDTERSVWVADSFEGLPKPDVEGFPADKGDRLFTKAGLQVTLDQVKHNFERYGLLDDRVRFLQGWFKDTLPGAPIERLSVMRLDGDLYESTWQAIEALYPKLSRGGFCIVDDFGSHPDQCQKAIHDYRATHGITEEIIDIDGTGAYWRRAR